MANLLIDGDLPMQVDGPEAFRLSTWIDTAPFEDLVGLEHDQVGEGRATLSCLFRVKLAQGGGVMHGGALTTLADTAVAMAIKSLLPAGTIFATTELTMRFLAPVREGRVRAEATVTGPEGRTFFGAATICDAEGRAVAEFSSVFRVARGQGFEDATTP